MIDRVLNMIGLLGHWGYLIIFIAAFLESAAFMGLLVPGESIVVLSGFLASQGYLEIGDLLWVVSLGAVLGDSVGYSLGKAIGRGYFKRHKRLLFLKDKHFQRVDTYFRQHGGKTIFFGRFVGFLRAMAPFAAGMSRMPYGRFLVYNAAGGILWSACFILLGYCFGQSWQLIDKWAGRTGLFALFILLLIAGFSYLYRTLVKRQTEVYGWFSGKYRACISNPQVKEFINHHPKLVVFIRERLSPAGYLGLHLTVGLALSAVFAWIFGGITEDILTGDPFVAVDQWVLHHVLYFRTPLVSRIMIILTQFGGWKVITVGSLVIMAYLLLKRRIDYLVSYVVAILGGNLLFLILKMVIHRMRPISEASLIGAKGWSFPSGHAAMSLIFYGIVTYCIVRSIRSWKPRVFTVMAALFVVFLIGFSRIYLQVHYLSDVVAGYVAGLFWLTICLTGLEIYGKQLKTHVSD
jgi:membrane protein DedA with SNARE-associated domain/membrane-associated phospholipid phosphatase